MEENPFVEEGMVCANCVFYEGGQGCEIVTGLIDPMALCKFWIIPEDLLTSVSKHRAGQHDQKSHGSWAGTSGMDKPDNISYNGDTIKKGKDSMWEHLAPDGQGGYKLTAERTKIYEKIVKEHLKGITPTGNPTFTLMGGGGGSGKGTVQESPIAMSDANELGVKIPTRNVVRVDPDEIKSRLPEFSDMVSIGRKEDAAAYVHEESSAISKIIQRQAFSRGLDVLLDGTGNSKAIALQKKINQARDAGYTVNGAYVSASIENSWQRNMARAVNSETRGLVPAWAFLEAHKSVSDIIPYMAKQFDNWVLFDTNGARGSTPPIIAVGSRGVPVQVIDRTAYKRFIDKAFSKVTPNELDAMWDEFKVGKI
jgi:predicted ABC-type ATPase